MIPADWEESFILNLYKGKAEALDHGFHWGLKLTDEVIKLLERVLDFSIHQMVNIDELQFTFVPGRGTNDAIFIDCFTLLLESHLADVSCLIGLSMASGICMEIHTYITQKRKERKVQEILPVLTYRHLSPKGCGNVHMACVCAAMLHGSKTLGPNISTLEQLCRNDCAMICWIFDWDGMDMCRQCAISSINSVTDLQHVWHRMWGRPRKTWLMRKEWCQWMRPGWRWSTRQRCLGS